MSTPEILLQLDNFMEKKGLLRTENPTVGPPAPTTQQSLESSLDAFMKYKGFQLPGDLPNEKPPEPTAEMRGYMAKEFQPGKVQPSFTSTPSATEGEPPKIEMTPGLEPTFWKQAKDLALAWAKGKIGPEDLVGVDFFKGLTLGNADPYAIVEWISGKPGFKEMAETATRAKIVSAVGYEPRGAVAFAGGASRAMGNVIAFAPILKGAQVTAKLLPAIPMLRAAARGVVAGALTGAIQKPEDEGVWNRLKQIPPNVLFFTAFETIGLAASQALKIFEWNLEYGKFRKGGPAGGQTVEYISKEVPGVGRTEGAANFTSQEMKDLFRKMQANVAGTGGEWSKVTPREQFVINEMAKPPGWKRAVKEGFFSEGTFIPGEPTTIYGAKVKPELVPRKPQMGDVFRNEAGLPKYQPTIAEQEMWPSRWPREGQPSPVEPPIPGETAAGPTPTAGPTPPPPPPPPSAAKAGPKATPGLGGAGTHAGPTVTPEGTKIPVGGTTLTIRPQADGSIKVEVEPNQVPWPADELWTKAEQAKAEVAAGEETPTPSVPKPKKRWSEQLRQWVPPRADKYPARDRSEMRGFEAWKYDDKMGGLPRKEYEPPRTPRFDDEYYFNKEVRRFYSDVLGTGEVKWGDLAPEEASLLEGLFSPEEIEEFKSKPMPRFGPHGETLGTFEGVGYQGPDREQVREEYRKWYASMAKPKPPAQGSLFGAEVAVEPQTPGGGYTPTGKQPWEMTKAEYLAQSDDVALMRKLRDQDYDPKNTLTTAGDRGRSTKALNASIRNERSRHEQAVMDAVRAGNPVPAEVLADYPDLAKPAPQPMPAVEQLPPGEAYNIRKDAEAKAQAEADYAKNLRAGTIERTPKPEVPAVQFTAAEKAKIAKDVTYLTSRSKTPRVWRQHPEQIEANRNELIKQALLKLPAATPEEIKKFVNNYAPNIKGERLQTRKEQAISKEGPYPIQETAEGTIDTAENLTKDMLPTAGTGPINKKPVGEQEVKYERSKDIFTDAQEETRVIDILNKAVGGDPKKLEIMKAKLLSDIPETDASISQRTGVAKSTVSLYYRQGMEALRGSEDIQKLLDKRMIQLNIGVVPTKARVLELLNIMQKYFSSTRGVNKTIDLGNDGRVGEISAGTFHGVRDIAKLKKWIKGEHTPGLDEYVLRLFRGDISGLSGYDDIANSALPPEIKDILTRLRTFVDLLSAKIKTYGNLGTTLEAVLDNNIGKYLTDSYKLYESKYWDPPEADRAPFRQELMQQNPGWTDEDANTFMEAILSDARRTTLFGRRRSKSIPTETLKHRKELTPAYKRFIGPIDDNAPFVLQKTIVKQVMMAANAQFIDLLVTNLGGTNALWTNSADVAGRNGWQNHRLPSTHGYGKLKGNWVHPELEQYIKRELDFQRSEFEELVDKLLMRPFKWNHTIGSTPTHARNGIGNAITFAVFGRCSPLNPLNAKWYLKSLKAHLTKTGSGNAAWEDLLRNNAVGNQYYGNEIKNVYSELRNYDPASWPRRVYEKTIGWPIGKLASLYNFEDSLFRVASWYKDIEHFGLSKEEAMQELTRSYPDYRKNPVVVDMLKRIPLLGPFVSFAWNTGAIMGRQATQAVNEMGAAATRGRGIARILRLAFIVTLPFVLEKASEILYDVDDKDIEELKKRYSRYQRSGSFVYSRDDSGKLRITNASYLFPQVQLISATKSLFAAAGDALHGRTADSARNMQAFGDNLSLLSVPLLDLANTVKGTEPRTGRELRGAGERLSAIFKAFYLPASSPIPDIDAATHKELRPGLFTGPQFTKIYDAINQQPSGRLQWPKSLKDEVVSFTTGIRTQDLDPERILNQEAITLKSELNKAKSDFMFWTMNNSKASQRVINDKTAELKKKVEELGKQLDENRKLFEHLRIGGFQLKDRKGSAYDIDFHLDFGSRKNKGD